MSLVSEWIVVARDRPHLIYDPAEEPFSLDARILDNGSVAVCLVSPAPGGSIHVLTLSIGQARTLAQWLTRIFAENAE